MNEKTPEQVYQFPPGWDEQRVREVIRHYDEQTEEEAVAEDEAAAADSSQVWMEIPVDIVPLVRQLLAEHGETSR